MKGNNMAENTNIEDLRAPLLAALGAADLALATVNDLILNLRDRAEETRGDTRSRVEESRARITKLQEDLPEQIRGLRERFTSDELRKAAEATWRPRPAVTASWSSAARPPWSGCAPSRPSRTRLLAPRRAWTRPSS